MSDKVVYKGGKTVASSTGDGIKLVMPKAGNFSKFPRWWNKKPGAYIDCAIFKVTLDSGVVVRLVVPATDRMTLEIRHDGFGNFTFPIAKVERIGVVAEDSTELLVEYQFSKISGGSVLKRTLRGIPKPPAPVEPPKVTVVVEPQPVVEEAEETEDAVDLDSMTKQQLLDWALEQGHDLVDGKLKAEILVECKAILADD